MYRVTDNGLLIEKKSIFCEKSIPGHSEEVKGTCESRRKTLCRDSPMVSEVILSAEGFSADVATVGALVGVRSLVDQQIVRLRELPITELADELLFGS